MKRDMRLYINDILESIKLVEEYTAGLSLEEFSKSQQMQDSVIRRLEVIGEAAKHIDDKMRERYAAVPWKKIVAIRNVFIHEYFGINLERVWVVAVEDLPRLKPQIQEIWNDLSR
jgi:uncharacterized protein with HEPN domain